jgi:hypothetical protein
VPDLERQSSCLAPAEAAFSIIAEGTARAVVFTESFVDSHTTLKARDPVRSPSVKLGWIGVVLGAEAVKWHTVLKTLKSSSFISPCPPREENPPQQRRHQ